MSKRMDPQERKEFILDIAKELFAKNGYYETQIHDIVTKAGISRGTVYQYFNNKDDLFITLLENFYKTWEKEIKKAIDPENLDNISPKDYFRFRMKQSFMIFANDQNMAAIVLRNAIGLGGNLDFVIKRFEKRIRGILIDDLKLGQKYGFIKKDLDIEVVSDLLTGAVFKLAHVHFSKKKNQNETELVNELTEKLVNVFVNGISEKNS